MSNVIQAIGPDDPPGKLPFRIVHALNAAGIKTYSQLSNYTEQSLLTATGLPRCDISTIKAELYLRNLPLKTNSDEITPVGPDEPDLPGKLPSGIVHGLNAAGITTYEQLAGYAEESLLVIPGFSHVMVARIKEEMSRRGLALRLPSDPSTGPAAPASLRDQFAMAALVLDLDRLGKLQGNYRVLGIHEACVDAYALADEMLKVRT